MRARLSLVSSYCFYNKIIHLLNLIKVNIFLPVADACLGRVARTTLELLSCVLHNPLLISPQPLSNPSPSQNLLPGMF